MKVKKSDTPDGKIELLITAPAEKVLEAIRFMDFQLAMQNGIDVQNTEDLTSAVIEKVGEAYYLSFVSFEVMRFLAPFAVGQEKIDIIGNPMVEPTGKNIEPGKELTFKAVVIPKPIYEIDDFSPVKIKIPKVQVSEAEIDQQLLAIADSYAQYKKDKDHPVEDGTDLIFSIKTFDAQGEEVPQLTAERRAYTVGQNYIPGDFDQQLIGMLVGETKTFDVTAKEFLREESEDPEAAETLTFTITVTEVQKRVIPAITDNWVQQNIPELSSVPELREMIRNEGIQHRESELKDMKNWLAASEFAKRFKGSIPDELYEMTREDIMNNLQQNLKAQGKTIQEFIKEQAGGDQQFSMQLMMQTREVLTQSFSLDALVRHLNLEVTEADIMETFHAMAPEHEKEARMEFELTGRMYQIEEGALRAKANRWLVENADIEYLQV